MRRSRRRRFFFNMRKSENKGVSTKEKNIKNGGEKKRKPEKKSEKN